MKLLLLLALFSGKLDDPSPPVARSHKLDDAEGWPPRTIPVAMKVDESRPAPNRRPAPKPAPLPATSPPQLWQLTDRFNQRWTHANPQVLKDWVRQRNAIAAPQRLAVPVYQFGSPCSNGSCPR